MNRATFFSSVRSTVICSKLSETQVSGIVALLDACLLQNISDLRQIAYVLATPCIETGMSFEPITENLNYTADGLLRTFPKYFSPADAKIYARQAVRIANRAYGSRMGNGNEASSDGHRYRGRGYVQITGKDNYTKFGRLLGIDLVGNPDLALEQGVAATIATIGMRDGIFTGRRLGDYFGKTTDWVNARRIINGVDRAEDIARYAKAFHSALEGAA
ncbi:hypothetical protein HB770_04025 [Rhizobium leguminosarum bv. viciae]|uniref:Glycoside hydrolase family 19 catalytic domain-containing protein n=1 Tax=Rhizobium leguminosarum bv. viciae TaxID=387 RepID=A0A7G6RLS4_RHILV|nr:hypothetical protein HB770_04025 [Rhizobium leguminosarum bv. viciae]